MGPVGVAIPHDPHRGSKVCPICEEEWPCIERRKQRATIKDIKRFLHSDLYRVDESRVYAWPSLSSPLGFTVAWSYGETGVQVKVYDSTGAKIAQSTDADAYWLDEVLP